MASNAAKSYIEAVMARADGATEGPWRQDGDQTIDGDADGYRFEIARLGQVPPHYGGIIAAGLKTLHNGDFIAHARQDIPTLAKMLLRAVTGLNEMRIRNSWAANVLADELLAEINDMAKGSQ